MCQSLITSLSVTIPPYCAHCAPKSTTFPRNRSWAVIGRVWCGAGGRDCIEWTSSNTSLAINHVHEHLVLSWQGLSLGRLTAVAYPGILFGGGGVGLQQIQLNTEDTENGDLRAVAPQSGVLEVAVIWWKKFHFI